MAAGPKVGVGEGVREGGGVGEGVEVEVGKGVKVGVAVAVGVRVAVGVAVAIKFERLTCSAGKRQMMKKPKSKPPIKKIFVKRFCEIRLTTLRFPLTQVAGLASVRLGFEKLEVTLALLAAHSKGKANH